MKKGQVLEGIVESAGFPNKGIINIEGKKMVTEIVNIVSNVGFPIAISIALFYQLMKTNEMIRDFQSTIVKNTDTIGRLVDSIESHDENNKVG